MLAGDLHIIDEDVAACLAADSDIRLIQGVYFPGRRSGLHNQLVCHVFLRLLLLSW